MAETIARPVRRDPPCAELKARDSAGVHLGKAGPRSDGAGRLRAGTSGQPGGRHRGDAAAYAPDDSGPVARVQTCGNAERNGLQACLAVGLVLGVLLAGCGGQPSDSSPDGTGQPVAGLVQLAPDPFGALVSAGPRPQPSPELHSRAEDLFAKQCVACHGAEGRGDGLAAYLLYPKPRDFGEAKFRFISTDNDVPSDEDLFRTITRGMPLSTMPSWGHLSEEDRWAVIYYVRELAREGYAADLLQSAEGSDDEMDFGEDELSHEEALEIALGMTTPGRPWPIPPETSPLTLEALGRGRQLFMATCMKCHGVDGTGSGMEDLVDEKGAPIRPGNIVRGIFKGGKSGWELANRILSGMPGTAMPSHTEIFHLDGKGGEPQGEDLWALIHYVQSLIPPGAHELAVQGRKELRARRVDAVPENPADPIWATVRPTHLALMRLWWTTERPGGVQLRALHDGKRLGLHLSWEDGTINDHVLKQEAFSDAAAVQLSAELDPPLFTMGAKGNPVSIWQWKAHWQRDLDKYADIELTHPRMAVDRYAELKRPALFLTGWGAQNLMSTPTRKSAVESLVAIGFGTLTSLPPAAQNVTGRGKWEKSFWQVTFRRDLSIAADGTPASALSGTEGAMVLAAGKTVSIGFAVWDGHAGDRDGQKSVTIWHRLTIE